MLGRGVSGMLLQHSLLPTRMEAVHVLGPFRNAKIFAAAGEPYSPTKNASAR